MSKLEYIPEDYSPYYWISYRDGEKIKEFARNRLRNNDIKSLAQTLIMIGYATRSEEVPFDIYARQYCEAMTNSNKATEEMKKLWPLEGENLYLEKDYSYKGLEKLPNELRRQSRDSKYKLIDSSTFNHNTFYVNGRKYKKDELFLDFSIEGRHYPNATGIKSLLISFTLKKGDDIAINEINENYIRIGGLTFYSCLPINCEDYLNPKEDKYSEFVGYKTYDFYITRIGNTSLSKPNNGFRYVNNLYYDCYMNFSG